MQRGEPGSEKRTSARRPVVYAVTFRSELLEFDGKAEVVGEVLDMSQGGLFIRSEFLEAPGTPVSLVIWLPTSDHPISLRGKVAWVSEHPPKGPGMGIKLAQSSDA